MATPLGTVAPAKRRRYPGRVLGWIGIASAFVFIAVAAGALLAGSKTRLVRSTIAPGMSVEEVVGRAGGWLSCRASAHLGDKRVIEFEVWSTGYRAPGSEAKHTFSTRQEMAKALAAEVGQHHAEWRLTFGYITIIPKRIYFDVEFSPDGRVRRVSDTRWGRLD